jgi:hypothetical protein
VKQFPILVFLAFPWWLVRPVSLSDGHLYMLFWKTSVGFFAHFKIRLFAFLLLS